MPLINFKTNFTSLRFGMDQPGGGDSGQPFIQAPIDNVNLPVDIQNIYERNRISPDYPIRGGSITSLVDGGYTTDAALIDLNRIKKFFKTTEGETFIRKQRGLQLTNPITQVPNSLQFVGVGLGNAVIPVTQVYNPANTLAQVGVQGNGTHFNRHGVNPNIYEPIRTTYQYIVGNPANNTATTNRLAILKALKLDLSSNVNFITNSSTENAFSIDQALVDRLGISTIQSQLFNYPGGPGSNYGVGFTRIFRATNSQGVAISTQPTVDPITAVPYSIIALTYAQLANQKTRENGGSPTNPRIQDFRSQTNNVNPVIYSSPSDYRINLQTNYNIGDPGKTDPRANYTESGLEWGVDKLNKLNPLYFNPATETPWGLKDDKGTLLPTNDLIKFAFECIDNDNPTFSAALIFRAFLEGTINDSNTAQYNTFKYLGRGETFRTYQGVDRSISFTFKVFVQSRQEMQPLYKKLNQLISQVYPDYSETYGLMRGNVVKVTIGDYIYRMPGFLENVNVTIDNSNTPWEILEGNYTEDDVRQLPHMVTVQCNFKPIMDILPRKVKYKDQYVPLIVNGDSYLQPPTSIPSDNIPTAPPPRTEAPIITTTGVPLYEPLAPQLFTGTPPNLQPQLSAPRKKTLTPPTGNGTRLPKATATDPGTGLTLSTAAKSGTYQPTTRLSGQ